MIYCDKCQGTTNPKQINTKRGPATIYECTSGCKNDKGYAHGVFAPRGSGPSPAQPRPAQVAQPQGAAVSPQALTVLKSIDSTLKDLRSMMQKKWNMVVVDESQLEPDDEIPF